MTSAGVSLSISNERTVNKKAGKRIGLGLAIARQIVVEKHDGTLEAQSEVGQGTYFCLLVLIRC
jgi:signal transduction histidine kinase